ncbi:hypothetical protein K490DRAFT_53954 [Saccharata proteae CBS 121410]|uniref:Uncharacterized protein n=1 Tax=Saccharata proteae CBS 121410 TaxID=1314787 RepID=A0A9P4LZ67_9PEZI|nr:hypothetical protein K490DRAFT_53954 [Saccharata proteae CBS 121410]
MSSPLISRVAAVAGATKFVHLTIHPRPSSMAESREVLRLLQQFGEVVMFRNLGYVQEKVFAPNVCLAIFKDEWAGARLIREAPLTFTIEPSMTSYSSDGQLDETDALDNSNAESQNNDAETEAPDESNDVSEPDAFDALEQEWVSRGTDTTGEKGQKREAVNQAVDNNAEELKRPARLLIELLDAYHKGMHAPLIPDGPNGPHARRIFTVADLLNHMAKKYGSSSPPRSPTTMPGLSEPSPPPLPDPYLHAPVPEPSQEPKTFRLLADLSLMNHRDYVMTDHTYWKFHPTKRSLAYHALRPHQPLRGLCDITVGTVQVPDRLLKAYKSDRWKTVRDVWEEGRAETGYVNKERRSNGRRVDRLLGFQHYEPRSQSFV